MTRRIRITNLAVIGQPTPTLYARGIDVEGSPMGGWFPIAPGHDADIHLPLGGSVQALEDPNRVRDVVSELSPSQELVRIQAFRLLDAVRQAEELLANMSKHSDANPMGQHVQGNPDLDRAARETHTSLVAALHAVGIKV